MGQAIQSLQLPQWNLHLQLALLLLCYRWDQLSPVLQEHRLILAVLLLQPRQFVQQILVLQYSQTVQQIQWPQSLPESPAVLANRPNLLHLSNQLFLWPLLIQYFQFQNCLRGLRHWSVLLDPVDRLGLPLLYHQQDLLILMDPLTLSLQSYRLTQYHLLSLWIP